MTALWIIIRATAIFGLVAIVERVVQRRASAAARHFLWALAIAGALLVPVLSLVLPEWSVVIRTTPAVAPPTVSMARSIDTAVEAPLPSAAADAGVDVAPAASPAPELPWSTVLFSTYVAGAAVMLIHLIAGRGTVRRLVRRATVVSDPEWAALLGECAARMNVRRAVRLLQSREQNVPVALGTIRPSIVVPAIADTWDNDRRRAVLLHEMAHVARYDCLTQTLAVLACLMYWFHPAAWFAARRLRIERELACDDKVIACGTEGRDYAGHLLEIAYSFGNYRAPALAVGMARPNQLEGRMLAALDASRNRSVPPRRVRLVCVAVAAAVLVALSGIRPTTSEVYAQSEGASPARSTSSITSYSFDESLRAITGPFHDTARRLVRRAARAFGAMQVNQPGTWEIRPTTVEGTVHLRLVELNSSTASNIRVDQFDGLTAAQLTGPGGQVQFRLRRDAGTFSFEGVMRSGVGAGTFTFVLNPTFADDLAKRGFSRPTLQEQYELARADIGFAFLDELTKQGYAMPRTDELLRAAQHGVHVTYLQEMGALGYRLGSLDALITLRDHGVSPSYIREMVQYGYKGLTAEELRNARDHGVGPDYVRGMRDLGYGSLSLKELIGARDHGVGPEYIRGLNEAGYRKLSLEELIRTRDHGISAEYVRDMRQLGHTLPLPELINARDHGVSVEYVREMEALGYTKLSMDALIRLRDHGVSVEYVRALKELGYDRLSMDDLITLRDHGLSPERIRAANARAGSRLPVDLLKSLAAGGMR
jgi:beta-lactamase regulating signal transducer with metallopeptidase domain